MRASSCASANTSIAITVGEPIRPTAADHAQAMVTLQKSMSELLDQTIEAYPDRPAGAWWVPRRFGGSAPTLEEAAALIGPGNAVGVMIYENTWAGPFVAALRRVGAEVISSGRIPAADVLAALDQLESGD